MAMYYLGFAQFTNSRKRKGIAALAPHEPRLSNYTDVQFAHVLVPIFSSESNQSGRYFFGHVACEFEYVTLAATDDAVVRIEECRDNMDNAHLSVKSGTSPDARTPRFTSLRAMRLPGSKKKEDHTAHSNATTRPSRVLA